MKTFVLTLWNGFKAPIVWVGGALIALILVIAEAWRSGRRGQQIKDAKVKEKESLHEIDKLEEAGDADGLHDHLLDHLKRRGRK